MMGSPSTGPDVSLSNSPFLLNLYKSPCIMNGSLDLFRFRMMPGFVSRLSTFGPSKAATFEHRSPHRLLCSSPLFWMVSQLNPACADSNTRNSKCFLSSWTGLPFLIMVPYIELISQTPWTSFHRTLLPSPNSLPIPKKDSLHVKY